MTDLDELAEALAAFQSEVPVVPKKQTARIQTERGRDYSYTYADLATIAPVVMPLLAKHGLSFTALPIGPKGEGRGPVLRGMLLHTSGQHLSGELPITGRTPQEIGSSLTYGRRYLLGCLTGVVTDDDDDGQLSERAARARPRKDPAPPSPEDLPVAPPAPIQRRTRPRQVEESAPVESAPNGPPHGSPTGAALTPGADSSEEASPKGVPDSMRRALFGAIGKALGPEATRAERLALCTAILGRPVESSNDLDPREVSRILEWLERRAAGLADWSYDPYAETGYVFALDTGEVGPEGPS